jgi:ribonuclease P protein component
VTCPTGRFPPASRLRTAADFKAVFSAGQRSSDPHFTILTRPNGTQRPRLGFAIARSRIPRAVTRNRLKRIVRESFRTAQDGLGGIDLVVMAKPAAGTQERARLRASLNRLWKRIVTCAPS